MARKSYKQKYNSEDGVWRTIGGRRVFIRHGQSLSEAMKESGKFKIEMNEKAVRDVREEDLKYRYIESLNNVSEMEYNGEITRDEYDEAIKNINKEYKNRKVGNNFYTRKDGTKEYDPYKGTKFEKKYDSMDDVIKDPNSALNKYISEKENNGFTQQTDMYGGTREYSNEDLKRMEKAGVKPLEHSYTGGGWEGTKYNSSLSTKEIAKNISDYSKENFPDVKLSRKTDYNGIDIHIMSSAKDLYASEIDIDRMSDTQVSDTIRDSIGGYTRMDDWLNRNNRKSANGTFTVKDEKDYLKEELNTYKNRYENNVSGNEWYLSDYGKKVVSGLNKEMNSYNYDDSDGMVDYFDTNFYGYVHIGRWDRPYEVSNNESDFKKLYQQYLKEHKGSNMSLEDFKKWYK